MILPVVLGAIVFIVLGASAGMTGAFLIALVNGNLLDFFSQVVQGFFAPEAQEAWHGIAHTFEEVASLFFG